MLVKVISDYSVKYKGKLFSKGKAFDMDKDSAQALIKRGFVEEAKKEKQVSQQESDEP